MTNEFAVDMTMAGVFGTILNIFTLDTSLRVGSNLASQLPLGRCKENIEYFRETGKPRVGARAYEGLELPDIGSSGQTGNVGFGNFDENQVHPGYIFSTECIVQIFLGLRIITNGFVELQ